MAQQAEVSDLDPREQLQVSNGVQYAALIFFDDILPEDYRRIAMIPCILRRVVLADVESGFTVLQHYIWDGAFLGM